MIAFCIVWAILILVSFGLIRLCVWECDLDDKRKSKKYSLEEIDCFIKEDKDLVDGGKLDAATLELTLDHMEYWEQIRKYKLNISNN